MRALDKFGPNKRTKISTSRAPLGAKNKSFRRIKEIKQLKQLYKQEPQKTKLEQIGCKSIFHKFINSILNIKAQSQKLNPSFIVNMTWRLPDSLIGD